MSQLGPNTSLSLSARLVCYLGPPAVVLLTYFGSPKTALIAPITFLPTFYFLRKWRQSVENDPSRNNELEPLVWTFAAMGTFGLAAVAAIQGAGLWILSRLVLPSAFQRKSYFEEFGRHTINNLTPDELAYRLALSRSWQNWALISAFTFVLAGPAEEGLKYMPVAFARRRQAQRKDQLQKDIYLDYASAGGLSFGAIENIGFLYGAIAHNQETGLRLALTVAERLIFGGLGHSLTAALTALRATRRDVYGQKLPWWSIVGPAAVLHGSFDFIAFACSTLEGNVGWIHPKKAVNQAVLLGLVCAVDGIAAWMVRREWRMIQELEKKKI